MRSGADTLSVKRKWSGGEIREQLVEAVWVVPRYPASPVHHHGRQGRVESQELGERVGVVHHVAQFVLYTSFGKKLFHHTARASVVMRVEENSEVRGITHFSCS